MDGTAYDGIGAGRNETLDGFHDGWVTGRLVGWGDEMEFWTGRGGARRGGAGRGAALHPSTSTGCPP